jgi:hypothetical protein
LITEFVPSKNGVMKKQSVIPEEKIVDKIYFVRGKKVMLDSDLALLYNVETKRLKEAVRRNIARFPADFMFKLSRRESENLRSQIASSRWGGSRYLPMAFTEQGVAMLSSVLNSTQAIAVNIKIIRIFTKMREILLSHKDLLSRLDKLEQRADMNDKDIQTVFTVLKQLLNPPLAPRTKIGFKRHD